MNPSIASGKDFGNGKTKGARWLLNRDWSAHRNHLTDSGILRRGCVDQQPPSAVVFKREPRGRHSSFSGPAAAIRCKESASIFGITDSFNLIYLWNHVMDGGIPGDALHMGDIRGHCWLVLCGYRRRSDRDVGIPNSWIVDDPAGAGDSCSPHFWMSHLRALACGYKRHSLLLAYLGGTIL